MNELDSVLKQLKRDEIADKKDIMTTDGGTYKPVHSTVDAQILSIMGDQVKPLSNSCDSASNYYKNVEDVIFCDASKPTETVSSDATNTSDTNDTSNKASYKHLGKIQKKKIVPKNNILKKQYYEKKMKTLTEYLTDDGQ
ncbi:uncharacterized protein LOC123667262 [Melitaea cinxia]|uniref:uncharacterized protein LOC123667262 n=1 Tax=Melitaea cinxia TaxID=113334 RepID=UPI001E271BA3|nr:uncharacterized protein LOC123667262 [Melitaea cinxia]